MPEQFQKAPPSRIPKNEEGYSFLTFREIMQMAFRHKGRIAIFTLVVTVVAAVLFILQPRMYEAEGMFQVMPLMRINERVDRDLFETAILSHLEYVKSPMISIRVANELAKAGTAMNGNALRNSVRIKRPAKTSIISIQASARTPETAVLIAQLWMDEYMKIITESNVQKALYQVRSLINESYDKGLEKKARAEEMRSQAAKVENDRFANVSRSVDNTEPLKNLGDSVDGTTLKILTGSHLLSKEIEYLLVKGVLLFAEQDAHSTQSRSEFYQKAIDYLETPARQSTDAPKKETGATNSNLEVERYAQTLLDTRDIVSLGNAALFRDSRGALLKTSIVFVIALFVSCLSAFFVEWIRE